MNKLILRFGLYSSALMIGFFSVTWAIWGTSVDYNTSELLGYASMIISLSFVYFGVKAYRDEQNGGQITFGKALGVGSLIALLPSLAFAIYTVIFFVLMGDKWTAYALENMSEAQLAQFEANRELFMNPWFQAGIMFLTVFMIGFAYALISAFILKREKATL